MGGKGKSEKINADESQNKNKSDKYSMGRKYQNIQGFNENINRFKGKKHKSIISDTLRNNQKVKSNKYISAYDPATRQFVSGSVKEVATALKVSPATITSRFKVGAKTEMKDVKGFIIGKHNSIDKLVSYKNKINKEDKIIETPKPVGIGEAMEYLELLKPNYQLSLKEKAENKHFNTQESRFTLELSQALSFEDIEAIFNESIANATAGMLPTDKVRVIIFSQNLQNPFSTSLMNVSDMNAGIVMDLVGKVENYTEDFIMDESVEIIITTIHPEEKKKKKKKYKGHTEDLVCVPCNNTSHLIDANFKKSIIQIKNKDSLCVPRAIATGYYLATEGVSSKNYDNAKRGRKIQLDTAELFVKQFEEITGVPYDGEGFSVEDLEVYEKITGCQITAIDGNNSLNIVYPNLDSTGYIAPEDPEKTIYLYLYNGHCDLINNNRVAGFFGRHYFCHSCKKCYEKKDNHKCKFKCKMCCKAVCPTLKTPKDKLKYKIECSDCCRFFPNQVCFDNHKEVNDKGQSTCNRVWKCQECKKVMCRKTFPIETHICGDYLCKNCKRVVRENHECYMLPRKLNEPSEKYIFFDYEADISGESHEVMYAVSMYFSSSEPIIHETLDSWCQWAFSEQNKDYTFIAHNGMGYDYRFIIRWIYEHTIYKPFVIWGGQKIITMSIKELGIRFIDSLSFLTMPLKDFPKTFGEEELKKGFFPHWFNTKENWNYEGPMPPIEVFKPERMKIKDYEDFMKWYKSQVENNYVWNQKEEMKAYCISDVDILRKCCIKFRKLYLEVADIDPFTYLTIASVCMAIYKYEFIDETFPRRTKQINMLKKKSGDVSKLQGKQLDMWNKLVKQYEDATIDNVFSEKKIAIFKYEDVEWMRKAFFGGRTNATKIIYNFKDEEEGIYSDITSLYPTVNYYDIYPKGHPIIWEEDEIDEEHYKRLLNKEYLGFIDCEVEPPTDLYHPVLPTKGEKLIFDLLPKRGVWCSNEIYVAIDKGYKIKKIYEIRHFEEGTKNLFRGYVAKFLKIKQESSGYPEWVNEPNEINIPVGNTLDEITSMSIEERQDLYIHQYEMGQGILLDKTKICKNPGLRAIAKLCLNSLWGKFGQRTNMGRCEIVNNKADFFEIITNDKLENVNWIDIAEDKIQVSYTYKDEYVENDYNTNMAIACFTTSRARMRLYEEALDVLNRQVLYFDTDSVVYVYNPKDENHMKLKNGDLLGEWTDELEGDRMVGTFVSGGPKNYSYELLTKDGKTKYKTKVKGFTLNKETSEKINHNNILQLIKDTLWSGNSEDNKIIADWHGIKRANDNKLENISMEKRYGLCYTKRSICPPDEYGNYDTLPFGFINPSV